MTTMRQRRFGRIGTLRQLLALLAAATAFGCAGDTLYFEGSDETIPAPIVAIVDPVSGAEVLMGRVVRIRIAASDTIGITEIELTWRGVVSGSLVIPVSPPRQNVVIDTSVTLPPGVTGSLELQVTARNGLGGTGRGATVVLAVTAGDLTGPTVAISSVTPARLELDDSIRVTVTARDNSGGSGLVRIGLTALVTFTDRPDTLALELVRNFSPPRAGAETAVFEFTPPFVTDAETPRILNLDFHGFALDSAGNCGANTTATEARLPCVTIAAGGAPRTVASAPAATVPTTVVSGRSVPLPGNAVVPDATFDPLRERLYLSNMGDSRIEVLDVRNRTFGSFVRVGSEPWGVHINRTGDSLIVANSGGTNLSYVSLAGTPTEILSRRVRTPNTNIFIIEQGKDANDFTRLNVTFIDFSDRPQFIAQDFTGRLLYSTKPTAAAPDGTLRLVRNEIGWQQPEVTLLLNELVTTLDSTRISVVNVDSMRVFTNPLADDRIQIWDHVDGFPNMILTSGLRDLPGALFAMDSIPQSDIRFAPGVFALQVVGLRDTTFVAASGDRTRILFGEGSRQPGRLIQWNANTGTISNEITIADMVGNSAEHISGIALNEDGTFNAARGGLGAYFFREDLRLQGLAAAPTSAGAAGTQLHPDHPSYVTFPPSGASTLAFVAAGDVIRIFDTVHFTQRGEIPVRDLVSGPLRVSRPLAGETAGCPGPECIVAKLYGVTDAGAVVIVDVRTRHVQ